MNLLITSWGVCPVWYAVLNTLPWKECRNVSSEAEARDVPPR